MHAIQLYISISQYVHGQKLPTFPINTADFANEVGGANLLLTNSSFVFATTSFFELPAFTLKKNLILNLTNKGL